MINEVALLGEEEVSGDIFKNMLLPPILLDNELLNQAEALGEQFQIKSLEEISQDLSSKFWKKNISPSWDIIKSEHCTIKVRSFGNYSVNFTALSGLDAFQYIMREALKQDGESELSVINTESQIQCIKNVMAHGVDINKPYVQLTEVEVDRDDVTPLSQAASSNNIALLNFLLSKGGQVTPSVLRAIPSEISEFSNKSARTVSFLIGRGVDINMSDDLGGIMHTTYFSNCYNDSFMAFLLENGLDHKVMNKEGRSLLHIAAQKRNHDQSIMLMEKGADLYLADNHGITPFDLAEGKHFKSRLEYFYNKYQEQRLQLEKAKNTHLSDIEGLVDISSTKEQTNDTLEDQLDIKLKELIDKFIDDKPEYAEEIEKTGYTELKRQLIEVAKKRIKANQIQDKSQDTTLLDNITYGVNELFGIHEAKANPLVAVVIAEEIITYGGAILISALVAEKAVSDYNQYRELDKNFNKPKILSTPIPKQLNTTETFPQKDPNKFGQLPSFTPSDLGIESLQEGFDPYEAKLEDLILFNEETPQSRKCEKGESEIWQELDNYKVIQGKQVKTNSLSGKEKRYYQWDDWHKEIEVYDRHGKPLEVIDPEKGEIISKSLKTHKELKL
jgi:ankyrin repeat protein